MGPLGGPPNPFGRINTWKHRTLSLHHTMLVSHRTKSKINIVLSLFPCLNKLDVVVVFLLLKAQKMRAKVNLAIHSATVRYRGTLTIRRKKSIISANISSWNVILALYRSSLVEILAIGRSSSSSRSITNTLLIIYLFKSTLHSTLSTHYFARFNSSSIDLD